MSSSPSPPVIPVSGRIAALLLTAFGAVLMVVAVFADSIGLSGGGDGFGWKQLILAIVGLVILLSGIAWFLRPILGQDAEESLE